MFHTRLSPFLHATQTSSTRGLHRSHNTLQYKLLQYDMKFFVTVILCIHFQCSIDEKLLTGIFCNIWLTFLPARRYASAGLCENNVSVLLSVRLSVARRYCVKTKKKAYVMISSHSRSPTILVFWCQISSRHSKGFPRAGAPKNLKQGRGGKIQPFSSFKHQYLENDSR